jgi:hypothetical protein
MSEIKEVQGSWCPECGPDVKVDEDGCCAHCGADACGRGSWLALGYRARVGALEHDLATEIDRADDLVAKWNRAEQQIEGVRAECEARIAKRGGRPDGRGYSMLPNRILTMLDCPPNPMHGDPLRATPAPDKCETCNGTGQIKKHIARERDMDPTRWRIEACPDCAPPKCETCERVRERLGVPLPSRGLAADIRAILADPTTESGRDSLEPDPNTEKANQCKKQD